MKNLAYFASGKYHDKFQNLPYDRVFLIDRKILSTNNNQSNIKTIGKVVCLNMDALDACDYFRKNKIKLDCFVSINEGLYEGGGDYAIHSDAVFSYIMPLLKNKYIHIIDRKYYNYPMIVNMDWNYEKEEITKNDPDYIDPDFFSTSSHDKEFGNVYRMTKKVEKTDLQINPNIKMSIIQDSIWNHEQDLDCIGLSANHSVINPFFYSKTKTFSIRGLDINQILTYCMEKKIEKIGLTPWLKGKYQEVLEVLTTYSNPYPKQISFFHLNKKDFITLKKTDKTLVNI
jgi:hypothetical protein